MHSSRGVPRQLLALGVALPFVIWYTVGLRDLLLDICIVIEALLPGPLLLFWLLKGDIVKSHCSARIEAHS